MTATLAGRYSQVIREHVVLGKILQQNAQVTTEGRLKSALHH